MELNKSRILVDLSPAILSNSGIPLDTKWLFKQLIHLNRLDVSGLIYPLDWQNYNFNLDNVSESEKMLRYSQYLCFFDSSVTKESSKIERLIPIKILRKINFFKKVYFKKYFKLWLKDTKKFNDVIYRLFLEGGVASKDREIFENINYYFTDYFKHTVFTRLLTTFPVKLPKLDTTGFDFIIHQDSVPVIVSKGTQKIIRYHDPIPLLSPDLTQDSFASATIHYKSIQECVNQGAIYVCNSEPVEQELIELFPKLKGRTTTIPYTLSEVYKPTTDYESLFNILESKVSVHFDKYLPVWLDVIKEAREKPQEFKYVSEICTIEPRKNFSKLIKAFILSKSQLKKENVNLKLIIAGSLGWKYEKILRELEPLVAKGDAILLENLHPDDLKYLYSHSQLFLFPSIKEGFGLPPVEAMLCGVPVITSNIKVHKWVQGDSSFYVDPYSVEDIANKIEYIVKNRNSSDIKTRIQKGLDRASRYSSLENEKKWNQFFEDCNQGKYSK